MTAVKTIHPEKVNDSYIIQKTIAVNPGKYIRYEKPVEVRLDFPAELKPVERDGIPSGIVLHVMETDREGRLVDTEVPFQFNKDSVNGPVNRYGGTLVFMMKGVTGSRNRRYYKIRIGVNTGSMQEGPEPQILTGKVDAHGSGHWEIRSSNALYLYDISGGGFSEMRDRDGCDWIQFDNTGEPVQYRGIPNLQVYKQGKFYGVFHPGYGNVKSILIDQGPLMVSILSTADMNGPWKCKWDILPHYARCTVLEGSRDGFAFLYEGVPGGSGFNSKYGYIMEPDGRKTYFAPSGFKPLWKRDISPEWVYFGDDRTNRTLFYAHHEDDNVEEAMYQVFDALTVFGFGREAEPGINSYPAHFTIGFCESSDIGVVSQYVNSAYREISVEAGEWETVR